MSEVGLNQVTIMGRIGNDLNVKYSASGTAVLNVRVAVNERRKGPDEEWTTHTEWINVVVFGRDAENAGMYLGKGRLILVQGRLSTREYTSRDGDKRKTTEVVSSRLVYLDSQKEGGGGYKGGGSMIKHSAPPEPEVADKGFIDDDLPF